jgi:hypothetical protein
MSDTQLNSQHTADSSVKFQFTRIPPPCKNHRDGKQSEMESFYDPLPRHEQKGYQKCLLLGFLLFGSIILSLDTEATDKLVTGHN